RRSVPLIGFAGSPFTLACYMIEGRGSADFATVRRIAYARPDLLQHIVDINARAVAAYLAEQISAGVDAVMIFDTWGGLLAADQWRRFSLAPMRRVLERLSAPLVGDRAPAIVFTKGGGAWLDDLAQIGADCVGVDWTVDIGIARRQIGDRVAVQGNLDPMVLLTDPDTIANAADAVIQAAGSLPGHIFNLGHGIVPSTPPENVAALVAAVHRHSDAPSRQRIAP